MLLEIMASQPDVVENDPWTGLALSLVLQQIDMRVKNLEYAVRQLSQPQLLVEHARSSLGQNVVVTYLAGRSDIVRGRMAMLLSHVAIESGLIDRAPPRGRVWVQRREITTSSSCAWVATLMISRDDLMSLSLFHEKTWRLLEADEDHKTDHPIDQDSQPAIPIDERFGRDH